MNTHMWEERLLSRGIVDTHFHVGPEFIDRMYDVYTLAEIARDRNITLVLKNHTYPTTPLAALARARFGSRFLGSVVLNRYVGGLNPDAVRGAASGNRARVDAHLPEPRFVVYMPTVHAASHLRVLGCGFDPRWSCCGHSTGHVSILAAPEAPVAVFDEDLRPTPQLEPLLEAIAEQRAILATGHLSAAEIMQLVPMALAAGIERVLLTHPHYPSVDLSDEQLKQLAGDPRVFIEHCLAIHTIEGIALERFARSIQVTGPRQVVLATDFGQVRSDPVPDGTFVFAEQLYQLLDGMPMEDYLAMFTTNGVRALGLAEA